MTRRDAVEFMELAASIPIRTAVDLFPLEAGNEALRALAAGTTHGAAVLATGRA